MTAPKVTNLNKVDPRAERFSAVDVLSNASERKEFSEAPKLVIIAVNERGDYQVDMMRSGISDKDIIVLCEMVKLNALDRISEDR